MSLLTASRGNGSNIRQMLFNSSIFPIKKNLHYFYCQLGNGMKLIITKMGLSKTKQKGLNRSFILVNIGHLNFRP